MIDDAGRREMAEAGEIVLPVGIDERERLRQALRRLMMIEHDHVEAEPARELERLVADRAAIDGDDERRAVRREARDRLDVRAIALGDAVGDVDDRLAAAGGEIFAEERRAAGAVDVVVAEDRDPLAALDRALEPRRSPPPCRAGKTGPASGRARSDRDSARPPRGATPRPASTRARSSSCPPIWAIASARSFARAVEPRAPRPAERRALDVEKVAGHPSPSCIARLSTGCGAGRCRRAYPANRLAPPRRRTPCQRAR